MAKYIAQDVFLKVCARIESLHNPEKFKGWMFQIARNLIMDHFRKQTRSFSKFESDTDNEAANYNECVEFCLLDLLQQLPPKYREAIVLTDFENLSQIQLAERMQISYSRAKSRVQPARQVLRDMMDKTYSIRLDAYGNAIACRNRLPSGCE